MVLPAFPPDILAQYRVPFFVNSGLQRYLSALSPDILAHICTPIWNICIYRFYPRFPPRLLLKCTLFFNFGIFQVLSVHVPHIFAQMRTLFFLDSGFQWLHPVSLPRILLESAVQCFFKSGISVVLCPSRVFFVHLFKGSPLVYISGFQRFSSAFSPNVLAP